MSAIPTVYRYIRFRSRLEATWAAFFDLIGWQWRYEPIDLGGYIPDFIIDFPDERVVVEVKPILAFGSDEDIEQASDACQKIEQSGWKGSYLLVGSGLNYGHVKGETECSAMLGMAGSYDPEQARWEYFWFTPLPVAGVEPAVAFEVYRGLWARAQNQTQWKGGSDELGES